MQQSNLMSLIEAATNIAVGFALAILTQHLVFPLLGMSASLQESLKIGLAFTLVSLVRGYAVLWVFNRLQGRS